MHEMQRMVDTLKTRLPTILDDEELVRFCCENIAELRRLRELANIERRPGMKYLELGGRILKKHRRGRDIKLQSVLQDYLEAFEAHLASVHS